ncbi:unnamed protein product, partial [Effrenium voratum]
MVAELSGTTRGKSAAKDKPYRRRIGVPRERPAGPQRGAAESRSEDARQLQRFEELRQRGKPVWRWNHWRWVLALLVGIFTYEGGFFVLELTAVVQQMQQQMAQLAQENAGLRDRVQAAEQQTAGAGGGSGGSAEVLQALSRLPE